MSDTGRMTPLGKVADLIDCLHKTPSYVDEGFPMVRVTDIKRGFLDLTSTLRVDTPTYAEFTKRYQPKEGDILFTRVGSYGNSCYVHRTEQFCMGQNTVCISPIRDQIIPFFLYCCLNSDFVKGQIEGLVGGASQPTISLANINKLSIPCPDLPTQRRIASILSAYDDLIENNTRRIKILEGMAQVIYREWFVNFRFPGYENGRMVASKLGEIPEGWHCIAVVELLQSSLGGDWGSEAPNEEDNTEVYVIRGTDFDDLASGDKLRSPKRFITQSSAGRRILRPGDVLVENSVNAKSRCTGRPLHLTDHTLRRYAGSCIAASFCKVFRPSDESLAPILYLHINHLYRNGRMIFYQNVAANGIGNFQSSRFIQSECLALPKRADDLKKLSSDLAPFLEMSALLARKTGLLRITRDFLLPRLISGEIPVEAADEQATKLIEQIS